LLRATKAAEIKAAAATAAELKRIAAGADDIADNGVSGLKLQRVGAAGEGDGVGLTEEASPAGVVPLLITVSPAPTIPAPPTPSKDTFG
jgi:hypothetical protein